MTVVVTPVGTSLFTNGAEKNSRLESYFKAIQKCRASEWEYYSQYIKPTRKESEEFIRTEKESASAELQSIAKIAERHDDIKVHLLASDTIASRLAAEILADQAAASVLGDTVPVEFEAANDVIKGLQVDDPESFSKEGMTQLMRRINAVSTTSGGWGPWTKPLAINITGGYKATLPYLTILAQLNRIPLYYNFEDTDALIKIPQAPLVIDWGLIERHSDLLRQIEDGIDNWSTFKARHYQVQDLEAFIEVDGEDALLSPIGEIFWDHYQRYFIVELPSGSYYHYDFNARRSVDQAIAELYQRLNTVLGPEFPDLAECYKRIRGLGHNHDLNHSGQIPNRTKNIFIFKSTNNEQIRLLYTFTVKARGISQLTLFDILCQDFYHKTYFDDWKKRFSDQHFPDIDFVIRSVEIPS